MLDGDVPPADRDDIFMTTEELAARWKLDKTSLANFRSRGEGLPFVKLPSGSVRYRFADVLAAENRGRRSFSWARLAAAMRTYPGMTELQAEKLLAHLRAEMAKDDKAP